MVTRIAKAQHKQSSVFEVDDVEQAIWEFFAKKWEQIKGYDDAGVKTLAGKAASTWCQDQRNDFMYFTGAFIYTPAMVDRILSESVWAELGPGIDVEGRVDVQAHFGKLKESYQTNLYLKHAVKEPMTEAQDKSASRALERLTHLINSSTRFERVDVTVAANEL